MKLDLGNIIFLNSNGCFNVKNKLYIKRIWIFIALSLKPFKSLVFLKKNLMI